jgi:hypothetical protein
MVASKIIASGDDFTSLDASWRKYNFNHPNATINDYFEWKEITALDDWGKVASVLAPYIIEYGPKALSAIYNKLTGKASKAAITANKLDDMKGFVLQ